MHEIRRPEVCLVLLMLAAPLGTGWVWAQEPASVSFSSDLEHLRALAPRREGSQEERRAIAYVQSRLASSGLRPRTVSYAGGGTTHSYSSGLEVVLPGLHPDTLALVVPMDQPAQPGTAGASAGIALAIHTAVRLASRALPVSVRVVFLGAEHGEPPVYPLGSQRYLDAFVPAGGAAFVYLDLPTAPATISVIAGSGKLDAPGWLVRSVTAALTDHRLGYRLRGSLLQLNRLGLATSRAPLEAYLERGYPALALVGEAAGPTEGAEHPPLATAGNTDWVPAFDKAVDSVLQDLAGGIPAEWDRHYLTFQAGARTLIVPERVYVALLVGLVAVCALSAAFSGRHGRRYASAFLRGCWTVPLHLGLVFLFALVPTLAVEALLSAVGFPALWRVSPMELGILKALLAVALFALLTPLLTRTAIRRSHSFYAAAAIVTQSLVFVAVALYRVTLAVYFAWGLAFLFLATLTRRRLLKVLLAMLAPTMLMKTAAELVWLRELEFARWLLVDRVGGSLLVAAAAAPHYFMVLRLRLLVRSRRLRLRRALIAVAGWVLLMAASAMAAWVAYERPYRGGLSRPLEARAVVDYAAGSGRLLLACPIAIGTATVRTANGLTSLETRLRQTHLEIPPPPLPLELRTQSTPFLDRRNVQLTLAPRGADGSPWPYRFQLKLEADREFVLFDSSFPFQRSPEGTSYHISVGAGPPQPLVLSLTLPPDLALRLVVDAMYLALPPGVGVEAENAVVDPATKISVSFPFTT